MKAKLVHDILDGRAKLMLEPETDEERVLLHLLIIERNHAWVWHVVGSTTFGGGPDADMLSRKNRLGPGLVTLIQAPRGDVEHAHACHQCGVVGGPMLFDDDKQPSCPKCASERTGGETRRKGPKPVIAYTELQPVTASDGRRVYRCVCQEEIPIDFGEVSIKTFFEKHRLCAFEKQETNCPVCNEPQHAVPGGLTCKNGHGF